MLALTSALIGNLTHILFFMIESFITYLKPIKYSESHLVHASSVEARKFTGVIDDRQIERKTYSQADLTIV